MTFIYDGMNLVQEQTGGVPSADYLVGLGVDEVYSKTGSGITQCYLTDGVGSVIALVSSTGAVTSTYDYDPYGNVSQAGASSTNPLQFMGRENDGKRAAVAHGRGPRARKKMRLT